MAVVTITLTDTEDESVNIILETDPPIKNSDDAELTSAQTFALAMLDAVASPSDIRAG